MKYFHWALCATERMVCVATNKSFCTSIVSRLYLFPIVGSLFYDNVEQGKSKLPLLSFLLFACRVNGPYPICSISYRVNRPAHTLDAYPVYSRVHRANGPSIWARPIYSIGCRVNGTGPSSKRFRTDIVNAILECALPKPRIDDKILKEGPKPRDKNDIIQKQATRPR